MTDEAQSAILLLQMSQEQQQKSTTSSERKDRIIDCLFQNRRKTVVLLNTFRGLLDIFQDYVKVFQTEKPMIHCLHGKIVEVTQNVLSLFVKPEFISDSVSTLKKLDVTNKDIQKKDKDLGVGKFALADLNKARLDKSCHHWVSQFYNNLRTGYVMAAKKILKMPIENKTIRYMSVLDPYFVGHTQTEQALKSLAEKMPQALGKEDLGQLSVDVARYNVDQQVHQLASEYSEDDPVDSGYWAKVFSLKSFDQVRYPALKKLVSSLLTIFSGPLIESTFNIMDDIVEKDRANMTVVNYEGVAIVKTVLRKKKMKSTEMKVTTAMKKSCISAYANYKAYVKKIKEEKQKKHEQKLKTSVQLLKVERAKRIAKLVKLKNRVIAQRQKKNNKRNHSESESSVVSRWKRIKLCD